MKSKGLLKTAVFFAAVLGINVGLGYWFHDEFAYQRSLFVALISSILFFFFLPTKSA